MCQFISFFHRPDNGDIVVNDLSSHSNTESKLKLNLNLWREGHYLPDGNIKCRVSNDDKHNQSYCNNKLKRNT